MTTIKLKKSTLGTNVILRFFLDKELRIFLVTKNINHKYRDKLYFIIYYLLQLKV